jgi:hypothetical protein
MCPSTSVREAEIPARLPRKRKKKRKKRPIAPPSSSGFVSTTTGFKLSATIERLSIALILLSLLRVSMAFYLLVEMALSDAWLA